MPKHVLRATPYAYFVLLSRIIDFLRSWQRCHCREEENGFFTVGIFRPEPQAPGATKHRGAWMESAPIGSTKSKHVLPKTPLEERFARQRQYNNYQRDKGDTEPWIDSSVYFEREPMVFHSFPCEVDT